MIFLRNSKIMTLKIMDPVVLGFVQNITLPELLGLFKGAQSYFFNFFPNFWRFWYHKKAHIFLITHAKFHG